MVVAASALVVDHSVPTAAVCAAPLPPVESHLLSLSTVRNLLFFQYVQFAPRPAISAGYVF